MNIVKYELAFLFTRDN